jgi:hypothetical protein
VPEPAPIEGIQQVAMKRDESLSASRFTFVLDLPRFATIRMAFFCDSRCLHRLRILLLVKQTLYSQRIRFEFSNFCGVSGCVVFFIAVGQAIRDEQNRVIRLKIKNLVLAQNQAKMRVLAQLAHNVKRVYGNEIRNALESGAYACARSSAG